MILQKIGFASLNFQSWYHPWSATLLGRIFIEVEIRYWMLSCFQVIQESFKAIVNCSRAKLQSMDHLIFIGFGANGFVYPLRRIISKESDRDKSTQSEKNPINSKFQVKDDSSTFSRLVYVANIEWNKMKCKRTNCKLTGESWRKKDFWALLCSISFTNNRACYRQIFDGSRVDF